MMRVLQTRERVWQVTDTTEEVLSQVQHLTKILVGLS
jgi:hypothetical protein